MNTANFPHPDIKNLRNQLNLPDTSDFISNDLRVVTSGYLTDDPDWSCAPHMHDSAELIYCTAGSGVTNVNQKTINIHHGDLILYNPGTPHYESSTPSSPLQFFFVGLIGFKLPGLPCNTLLPEYLSPVQPTGIYGNQFETFFRELIKETIYCQEHYQYISTSIASSILALTMRILNKKDKDVKPISSHCIRIKEYLDKNFSSNLNLAQLSSAVFISKDYLSHIFKAEMGISPMQYLIKKRMLHAKTLLAGSEMSICQISLECGYDDPVYFSQIFKRVCGCSPKRYRDANKTPK